MKWNFQAKIQFLYSKMFKMQNCANETYLFVFCTRFLAHCVKKKKISAKMISWNNDDNNKNSWNSKINDVLTFCVRRNKWDRGWIQCRLDSTMCTSTTSSSCGWWWCSWCSIWHWHFLKKFLKNSWNWFHGKKRFSWDHYYILYLKFE